MLKTKRLVLDSWESSDWQAFRPIAVDLEVMRYINGGIKLVRYAILHTEIAC